MIATIVHFGSNFCFKASVLSKNDGHPVFESYLAAELNSNSPQDLHRYSPSLFSSLSGEEKGNSVPLRHITLSSALVNCADNFVREMLAFTFANAEEERATPASRNKNIFMTRVFSNRLTKKCCCHKTDTMLCFYRRRRRRRALVVPTAERELGHLLAEENCDEMRKMLESSSRAQDSFISAFRRCNATIPLIHLANEFLSKYPRVKSSLTEDAVTDIVALVVFENKGAFYDVQEKAPPRMMPSLQLSALAGTRNEFDDAADQRELSRNQQVSCRDSSSWLDPERMREVLESFPGIIQGQTTTLRVDELPPFDVPSIEFEPKPDRTHDVAVACCHLLAVGLENGAKNDPSSFKAIQFVFALFAKTKCSNSYEKLLDQAAQNLNHQRPLYAIAGELVRILQELDNREQQARLDNSAMELRLCAAERASHVHVFTNAVGRHQLSVDAVLLAINAASSGISADQSSDRTSSARHALTIALLIQLAEPVVIHALKDGSPKVAAYSASKIFQLHAFWVRHVDWCLDETSQAKSSLKEAAWFEMQRQALRALHLWLLLTRTALSTCQSHVLHLHRKFVTAALGDGRLSTPIMCRSSPLVEEVLWPTTLAIISAAPTDLAHLAPIIARLSVEALKNVLKKADTHPSGRFTRLAILQLRCLLAVALHTDPLKTVEVSKSCGVVPTLLSALQAPTRKVGIYKSSPAVEGVSQPTLFRVDDHVLALATAKNGKKRWFPARVEKINTNDDTFDIVFSSGSFEARVGADRIRRQRNLRQEQRKASCENALDENRLPSTSTDGNHDEAAHQTDISSEDDEDLWVVEVPAHDASFSLMATSRRASRRKESLRQLLGTIDIQATAENSSMLRLGSSASLSSMVTAGESCTSRGWNSSRQDEEDHLSPIVIDDDLHELSITLLLCLCVGASSSGGELEPSFCAPFPFASVRSEQTSDKPAADIASKRHINQPQNSASSVSDPKAFLVSGRKSFTSEATLSSRSALLSGRTSDVETARSSLLESTANADALGFHALDTLHRHFHFSGTGSLSQRDKAVKRVVPRVLLRLKSWKLIDRQGRADGAMRLLRLVYDDDRVEAIYRECVVAKEQSILGEGRFGTVIAAGEDRAAKLIQRERSDKDRSVAHDLFCEIAALERISKSFPSVAVELIDYGVHSECYVLVFERCRGGTLADWRSRQEDRIDTTSFLRIIRRIASCVACIAAVNVVHLDIKCENVLLRAEDPLCDDNALCIGDFGEARILESSDVRSGDGTAFLARAHGTECIQAPEILVGSTHRRARPNFVSASADVWSLGCLIFELACGQKLFETIATTDWSQFYVLLTTSSEDPFPPAELLEPLLSTQRNSDARLTELMRWTLQRNSSARPSAEDVASKVAEILLTREA